MSPRTGAAADRHLEAWAALRTARQVLELAEAEFDAAKVALGKLEGAPGHPA
jgi:hypothetical protein